MQKLWRCENDSKSAKQYEQRIKFRGKLNKSHAKIPLVIDHVSSIFNAEATTILEALELFNDRQMKNCIVS